MQNMQNMQPNQFRGSNGQNQFQNRGNGNNDRSGRFGRGNGGFNGRDNGQQRGFNNAPATPITDPNMFMPPTATGTNGTDGLILNFRDAQIDQVLNYLSDAAGFIIQLDMRVSGTISVCSAHPVSKSEAMDILNSALAKNGYYLVQAGRILRVMNRDDALNSQIPVIVGGESGPDSSIRRHGDADHSGSLCVRAAVDLRPLTIDVIARDDHGQRRGQFHHCD